MRKKKKKKKVANKKYVGQRTGKNKNQKSSQGWGAGG